jgi:hypothetical protein
VNVDLVIDEFEGGYRPTAAGKIGGRSFYFRRMGDSWPFGVSTEAAVEGKFWWHSPPEHFAFEAHGNGPAVWHSDSLPAFVEGLRGYLVSQGIPSEEQNAWEREARGLELTRFGGHPRSVKRA